MGDHAHRREVDGGISSLGILPFPVAYRIAFAQDASRASTERLKNALFAAYRSMRATGLQLLAGYLDAARDFNEASDRALEGGRWRAVAGVARSPGERGVEVGVVGPDEGREEGHVPQAPGSLGEAGPREQMGDPPAHQVGHGATGRPRGAGPRRIADAVVEVLDA
jgi:hypothetical protein